MQKDRSGVELVMRLVQLEPAGQLLQCGQHLLRNGPVLDPAGQVFVDCAGREDAPGLPLAMLIKHKHGGAEGVEFTHQSWVPGDRREQARREGA